MSHCPCCAKRIEDLIKRIETLEAKPQTIFVPQMPVYYPQVPSPVYPWYTYTTVTSTQMGNIQGGGNVA